MKDINPKMYTLSAVAVAFLLIETLNGDEQNALGYWLMLVSQTLCTNGYFREVKENNIPNKEETLNMLKKMVNALEKEIEEIKNTK